MESFITTVLAFLFSIGVLVAVHEYGHFWVARILNVKVLTFSIGFGSPLFKFRGKKDNTEYVIAAIPLGGYVKMLDEREGEVAEEERHRAFNRQTVLKRFAIVFAGPFVNFLFAIWAFWLMFIIGVQGVIPVMGEMEKDSIAWQSGLRQGDTIVNVAGNSTPTWSSMFEELLPFYLDRSDVELQLKDQRYISLKLSQIPADKDALDIHNSIGLSLFVPKVKPIVGKVFPDTPAETAGIQVDDEILSINEKPVDDWISLVKYVQTRPNEAVVITIKQGDSEKEIRLVTAAQERDGKVVGILGISNKYSAKFAESMYAVHQYPVLDALFKGVEKTWHMSALTLKMLGKMLVGEASLKNISGPITIAEVAGHSAQQGLEYFLRFLGIVSLSLGLINLLPIPVLDGGHLLFYLIEMVKGSPVSDKIQEYALKFGVTVLVMLMSIAIFNDINRMMG